MTYSGVMNPAVVDRIREELRRRCYVTGHTLRVIGLELSVSLEEVQQALDEIVNSGEAETCPNPPNIPLYRLASSRPKKRESPTVHVGAKDGRTITLIEILQRIDLRLLQNLTAARTMFASNPTDELAAIYKEALRSFDDAAAELFPLDPDIVTVRQVFQNNPTSVFSALSVARATKITKSKVEFAISYLQAEGSISQDARGYRWIR